MSLLPLLDRIRIVLLKPSHPGNIGACARAMKTMGLQQLVLVAPRFDNAHEHNEAIAMASGASDILSCARQVATLSEALEGIHCTVGLSARRRELAPAVLNARQGAPWLLNYIGQPHSPPLEAALLFGPERTGLQNEDLLLCQRQIMIDANPVYSSLNLAQAVQVLCYELRQAALHTQASPAINPGASLTLIPKTPGQVYASACELAYLQEHILQAMQTVNFLNPQRPKKLIARLQRLLAKASLERVEVDLIQGFIHDVIRVAQGRLYEHEKRVFCENEHFTFYDTWKK